MILVVDDYPDTLDVWTVSLQAAGFEVVTAIDGLTALAMAEALVPDLVVLDLELPGRSGYDVATLLRQNPATRHIPLIAATGFSHEAQLARARRAGFDVIVIKPCDPAELIAHIERLIANAASEKRATT
jgi:two-component system, cell cycle response regulator DivK